jgi:hypothetical protein
VNGCGYGQNSSFLWIGCGTDSRSKSHSGHQAAFSSLEDFLDQSRFALAAECERLSFSMVSDRGASDNISTEYGYIHDSALLKSTEVILGSNAAVGYDRDANESREIGGVKDLSRQDWQSGGKRPSMIGSMVWRSRHRLEFGSHCPPCPEYVETVIPGDAMTKRGISMSLDKIERDRNRKSPSNASANVQIVRISQNKMGTSFGK